MTEAGGKKREDWMSPLNKVIWMNAFRSKKKQVTIRDGRKFDITYDVRPLYYKTTGETRPLARVTCTNGESAPMGFFDLTVVTDPQWVTEDDKVKVTEPNVKSE